MDMTRQERAVARGLLGSTTVLILTYNEKANIRRTLSALTAFAEVVVLDSGSTDGTTDIARDFANVRVETRAFDAHADQWNHGLDQCGIATPWVLCLDADYVLPEALVAEIAGLAPAPETMGYRARFRYLIGGKPLSASLYPPAIVLFRHRRGRYVQQGHTQRLVIEGQIGELQAKIDHDDRKPLGRWVTSQQHYAALEADFLLSADPKTLRRSDRLRRMAWPAPALVFFYTLIAKRCAFDGWHGWMYVIQRTVAEMLIMLAILDTRLGSGTRGDGDRRVD